MVSYSLAVSENIYYLCKFRKYDIYKVGEEIGLTRGEIAKMKNHHLKDVSVDVMVKAVEYFDTDVDDILYTNYRYLWEDYERDGL